MFALSSTGTSQLWYVLGSLCLLVAGGFITFFFSNYLSLRLQSYRAARASIRKFRYPLLRAADTLDKRLSIMLEHPENNSLDNEYYLVSTLYAFGNYFGWAKIIENEAYLEYVRSNKQAKQFSIIFNRVFKGLTGLVYLNYFGPKGLGLGFDILEAATVPRFVLTAIGELMIKPGRENGGSLPSVIDFIDFARRFPDVDDFEKWFSYIEEFLRRVDRSCYSLDSSSNNVFWTRLVVFAVNLRVFTWYLDKPGRQTKRGGVSHYLQYLDPCTRDCILKETEDYPLSPILKKELHTGTRTVEALRSTRGAPS